jgi:hypothetical protein
MAAGLGFKDFATGEVLTAADVDGYLMQGVLVFADAAARDAAITSPQEGQCCYLKDTDAVQTYSGTAWVGFDDSNAIQNAIVDAKGDIVAASGNDTPARLAVGSNGDTLVADSAATVGLSYQSNFAAGKNKIINADFNINQRGFTSTTTTGTYGFDRFKLNATGGTVTYSAQSFTPGTAPVAGYEGKNFARIDSTGQSAAGDRSRLDHYIESVRTLAGQTATISFWARAASGTPKVSIELTQDFGTGGSPSSGQNVNGGQVTLSTTWTRFSTTVSVLSISGRTLGTNNNDALILVLWTSAGTTWNSRTGSLGIQTATIDFWGVQVEAGSVATAFQTATGTLQGELAACQRYYVRNTAGAAGQHFGNGNNQSTTVGVFIMEYPTQMRIAPTALEQSGTAGDYSIRHQATSTTASAVPAFESASLTKGIFTITVASGLTAGNGSFARPVNSTAYLGWSAEL